jgi:hypothetical protein
MPKERKKRKTAKASDRARERKNGIRIRKKERGG